MNTIGAAYIVSDANLLDYCFKASVLSISNLVSEYSVILGPCRDDTKRLVYSLQEKLGKKRFKVTEVDWQYDRDFQRIYRTQAIQGCSTDWILLIDADECLHSKDFPKLRKLVNENHNFINLKFNHYYGLPTWANRKPDWYQRHTRLWRKDMNVQCIKKGSCVCMFQDKNGRVINGLGFKSEVTMHHYGHVRDARVMGKKAVRFIGWYNNSTATGGGKLPHNVPFAYQIPETGHSPGFLEPYELHDHPPEVLKWLTSKKYILWQDKASSDNIVNHDACKALLKELPVRLTLLKSYKRKSKRYYTLEIENLTSTDLVGPGLRVRPRQALNSSGESVKLGQDSILFEIDSLSSGELLEVKLVIDTKKIDLESGTYEVELGLVKEGVKWFVTEKVLLEM